MSLYTENFSTLNAHFLVCDLPSRYFVFYIMIKRLIFDCVLSPAQNNFSWYRYQQWGAHDRLRLRSLFLCR